MNQYATQNDNAHSGNAPIDIIVVGGGGCGLTAAIAAAQSGGSVLVLEKMSETVGNTGRSGGMVPAAGTRLQQEAGISETAEEFAADIFNKNHNTSDREMTNYLARISKDLIEWLVDDVGIDLVFIGDFKYPGHTQFRMHAPPSRTGAALIADLRQAAEAQPTVQIVSDAPVTELVTQLETALDDGGQIKVIGVVAELDGKPTTLHAGNVILANNGFAGNPEMVAEYCPDMNGALYFGGPGNQGEGIRWGQALGAEVAFMDAYQGHASVATPEHILITYAIIMEGGFQVNVHGKRFGNESSGYSEHSLAVIAQPDGCAWDIYDERLHQLALGFEDYRTALDMGIVYTAATVEELATTIDVNVAALQQTLDDYHAAADGTNADPFGRRDCRQLDGPFYAVKVTGSLFHTQGGLRVDFDGRVLRPDGSPISNLYAGGGVAAGISGHGPGGYLSGNGLLTALGYGMLAGRHAAKSLAEGKRAQQL